MYFYGQSVSSLKASAVIPQTAPLSSSLVALAFDASTMAVPFLPPRSLIHLHLLWKRGNFVQNAIYFPCSGSCYCLGELRHFLTERAGF